MMFGMACFGFAMWQFSFITSSWSGAELLIPQLLRGFPQVFAVAPSVNLGLGSLPPERLKYASGLFNMMRNMGGAVGIAVSAAIINDQTNAHFNTIAAHLNPTNGAMLRTLHNFAGRYAVLPAGAPIADQAALHRLWSLAYREASTLAYADAFRAVMLAFIVATLLVPLMRKVAAAKPAASGGH
jgi:DHA2 family multidrug resistance protein